MNKLMLMDVRQLEILRELRDRGSIGKVAEAMLISPSAVSQHLAALQRNCPAPLTRKAGRSLVLTDAGQALAAAAVDVAAALAGARAAVARFVADPVRPIRVSAFHSAGLAFFPDLVARAHDAAFPRVECVDKDIAQDEYPELTAVHDLVIAHRLDHSPHWPPSVRAITLMREPLDVALPADHRLARKKTLTVRDVGDESWIAVQEGFSLLPTVDSIAAAARQPLRFSHRINEFAVATAVVAAGGGIALAPRYTVGPTLGADVVLRPLADISADRSVDVLLRPERAVERSCTTVIDALRTRAAHILATHT